MSSLFVRLLFAISPTIPLKNTDDGVRGRWDEMWGFLFRSNKETLISVKSVSESLGSSTLNKEKTNPIRQILVMRTKPCLLVLVCPFKGAWINYSHGQRSWSTFVFVGFSLNNTCPTPPPTHKLQVGRVYPEFFPSFSSVYGGGRENCKTFCTVLWGHPEITENHEYWIAVPRTFTRDINLSSYKAKPKIVC